MAKKLTNILEYSAKGEIVSLEDEVLITKVIKKDEEIEDNLDLATFKQDIEDFCQANIGKQIEFKFSIKEIVES